jgi:hypothetical protein
VEERPHAERDHGILAGEDECELGRRLWSRSMLDIVCTHACAVEAPPLCVLEHWAPTLQRVNLRCKEAGGSQEIASGMLRTSQSALVDVAMMRPISAVRAPPSWVYLGIGDAEARAECTSVAHIALNDTRCGIKKGQLAPYVRISAKEFPVHCALSFPAAIRGQKKGQPW